LERWNSLECGGDDDEAILITINKFSTIDLRKKAKVRCMSQKASSVVIDDGDHDGGNGDQVIILIS